MLETDFFEKLNNPKCMLKQLAILLHRIPLKEDSDFLLSFLHLLVQFTSIALKNLERRNWKYTADRSSMPSILLNKTAGISKFRYYRTYYYVRYFSTKSFLFWTFSFLVRPTDKRKGTQKRSKQRPRSGFKPMTTELSAAEPSLWPQRTVEYVNKTVTCIFYQMHTQSA